MKTKKQKIKQQIIATVITLFMFIMVFGSFDIGNTNAATVVNMFLIQNILAGTLSIECMSSLVFNDLTVGVAANSIQNMTVFNIRDYRGSGAGWNVSAYSNNLTINTAAAGINNISNALIAFFPDTASIIALDGSSTTQIGKGPSAYLNYARTLAWANAGYGMGNYRLNGTNFNIVYNGRIDQLAGLYQASVTFQIL